jgi:hypothetical protein
MAELTGVYEHTDAPAMYELLLTKEELGVIFFLTGNIGGDPRTSWRKQIDDMYFAIEAAGIFDNQFYDKNDPANLIEVLGPCHITTKDDVEVN